MHSNVSIHVQSEDIKDLYIGKSEKTAGGWISFGHEMTAVFFDSMETLENFVTKLAKIIEEDE